MKNIIVRKANTDELEKIILLSDELTVSDLPYDKNVYINWSHTFIGKKYYGDRIKGTPGICFVAQADDEIIGYLTAAIKEVPAYRRVKVADLENLLVDKDFRSKGVGKMLLDEFKTWAKKIKADKISVSVFALNQRGIEFYKREGFAPFDLTLEMYINDLTSENLSSIRKL